MRYTTRYVHKISPQPGDTGPAVDLDEPPTSNADCGRLLRKHGLLARGERVTSFRVEADGRIVAFPAASVWHSIILTPVR